MHDAIRDIRLRLHGAWRHRWVGMSVGWVLGACAAAGVTLYKDRHEAMARIHVNTQTVLKPLMAQLAVQPDIDMQVRMLARTLISRPRIEQLVDELGLPGAKPADMRLRDNRVTSLIASIKLEGSAQGNLYTISYRDQDPTTARLVVHTLVEKFVESGTGSKKKDSMQARGFIDAQISDYESKLTEAESNLKAFKIKNFGVSGASNQDFFARMAAISDEVNRIRLELAAAEQSRDALKKELSGETPQLPPEALPARPAPVPSELDMRLDAQRRVLDDLLRRFTDDHPDVISARRAIAQMERQRREEADLSARNVQESRAATNPVFQQLRVSLAQAEAQVASLRSQLSVQQGRLDAVRSQASRMPQVEAELAQLNRDYEVIRRNYQQLVERRESATLSMKMDDSSQLADFRIIEPATLLPRPVFPPRILVAVIGVLLSLAGGIAVAVGMTFIRPSVLDERQLAALSGRPVLGRVSLSLLPGQQRARRLGNIGFAGCGFAFLLCGGTWLAWVALAPALVRATS